MEEKILSPQFSIGVGVTCATVALGLGLGNFSTWAHLLYFVAWLFFLIPVGAIFKHAKAHWFLKSASALVASSAFLLTVDHYTAKSPRAELRVVGAELLPLRVGKPIQAIVKVENIGNAPVTQVGSIGYAGFGPSMRISDERARVALEDYAFKVVDLRPAEDLHPTLFLEAHSHANDIPIKQQHLVSPEDEVNDVFRGERAVFVTGRIVFVDAAGRQKLDYCFFYDRFVSDLLQMSECHSHNEQGEW